MKRELSCELMKDGRIGLVYKWSTAKSLSVDAKLVSRKKSISCGYNHRKQHKMR